MKEAEQRIAIAEDQGFSNCKVFENGMMLHEKRTDGEGDSFYLETTCIPDYPNDLNAMHEVEKGLPRSLKAEADMLTYVKHLHRMCSGIGELATDRPTSRGLS